MNKLIAFVLGLFMAFSVLSQTQTWTATWPARPQYGSVTASTAQAACEAGYANVVSKYQADNAPALYSFSGVYYGGGTSGGTCVAEIHSQEYSGGPTATSTVSWVQLTVGTVNACASKTGQATTVNFTEGFTRTTDEGDRSAVGPVSTPPSNGEMCSAGCKVIAQISGAGVQPYVSATATAHGLYRRSLDLPAQHTGQTCAGGSGGSAVSDSPVDPTKSAPTCPGFVGEVNGKPGCFGTAAAPVTTTGIPRSTDKSPVSGNPAAGDKPSSGEGSGNGGAGRTPSSGEGGNSGGPASAAAGPNGTTPKPAEGEEQSACGAPGQPKCGIDETGTPTGVGTTFDAAKSSMDASTAAITDGITGASSISKPSWSMTFQLPTGCTPYSTGIAGFVMDPCTYQPMIHDLMSMIWAAVTAFAMVGMVARTIRES